MRNRKTETDKQINRHTEGRNSMIGAIASCCMGLFSPGVDLPLAER